MDFRIESGFGIMWSHHIKTPLAMRKLEHGEAGGAMGLLPTEETGPNVSFSLLNHSRSPGL